jgi:hypothetical protein
MPERGPKSQSLMEEKWPALEMWQGRAGLGLNSGTCSFHVYPVVGAGFACPCQG